MKKGLIFIGQMPPVITGQSLVTQEIFNILRNRNANLYLLTIDEINSNGFLGVLRKLVSYFIFFSKFIYHASSVSKVVYLPAARSVHGFFRNAVIILYSKIFRHKLVVHFHCGDYNDFLISKSSAFSLFARYVFRYVNYSIILGESLRENYSLLYNLKMQVIVIPNGIRINNKKMDILPFSNEKIRLLYLSNLIETKGYLDLLESVRILVNDLNQENIVCDFCGSFLESEDDMKFKSKEEAKSFFFNFVTNHNLENNINFHGLVNGDLKLKFLKGSDIFVLPTYYGTEAQPISVLEAMSFGKVVISTSHRAIPDMIINQVTGLIISSKSPKSIAASIISIVNNPQMQISLGNNAVNHVRENYSFEKFESRIVDFFENLEVI